MIADAGTVEGRIEAGGADPSAEGEARFSHNFFDLLPGKPRTIGIDTDRSLEDVRSALRIRTLADTPREGVPSEEEPSVPNGLGV